MTNQTLEITDRHLGEYVLSEKVYIIICIIHYDDFAFHTGMLIIMNKDTKKWLRINKKSFNNQAAFLIKALEYYRAAGPNIKVIYNIAYD